MLPNRYLWMVMALIAVLPVRIDASGERPRLTHVTQEDLLAATFDEVFDLGGINFRTEFNRLDGFGDSARPGLDRVQGPDAQSCAACHNKVNDEKGHVPALGGTGDIIVDEFMSPPKSFQPRTRKSLPLFGVGAVQLLAQEMTAALQSIREQAIQEAQTTGQTVPKTLIAKGVSFGEIVAFPDGTVSTEQVEGVDPDLIIKPFGRNGSIPTLRTATIIAMEKHLSMQAVERVGPGDPDGDGVSDELTSGDITAIAVWQAGLPPPFQQIPKDLKSAFEVHRGETLFTQIGCTSCHRPFLLLDHPVFQEPTPDPNYRETGPFADLIPVTPVTFDLTQEGPLPRFERTPDGKAVVRLFSDLKRHQMGLLPVKRGIGGTQEGNQIRNRRSEQEDLTTLITTKLWGVGSWGFWMRDGSATTLTEAILLHGGEAQQARDQFANLPDTDQQAIVEFLKSLVAPIFFQP